MTRNKDRSGGGEEMYIAELIIDNFRGFKSASENKSIKFHEGTNVIIGHNNSGKTTVIKALELLFDNGKSKRLGIEDFNKSLNIGQLKEAPPSIVISAKIRESENEDEYSDDLVTVSTWLEKITKPYEALITYKFFLPQKDIDEYKSTIQSIESLDIADYWREIEFGFLRKYTYKIYVGNPEHENIVDPDSLNKFDFQFLNAIRDVERDLFTGKNSLLKEVIDFFIDYDIKSDTEISDIDKKSRIKTRKTEFSKSAKTLIKDLQDRMRLGKKHMLKYAEETGASFDNFVPSFDGHILDTELYSALKLIVENTTGIQLPATQNGLGYNNLIYISLLLAKMQKNASGDYLGSNAKTFSILAIEEPEAHLHPSMQYKFLKFLNQNKNSEVSQIFITSHSPNVTAAVELEDIIVLYKENDVLKTAYPGKVFSSNAEDLISKSYIQRFLDVTKSDMFFSKSIIFVEGITEQLLVPEIAKILNLDLADSHVSVVNVGGRYFKHYLKLFDITKSEYAINKKIVCITDLDPVFKKKGESSWVKCLPFNLNSNPSEYEYNSYSNEIIDLYPSSKESSNIRVYSQPKGESCTFEYELLLNNHLVEQIITDSVRNSDEIKKMMSLQKNDQSIDDMLGILRKSDSNKLLEEEIRNCKWANKGRHLIAARYLASIQKGEVAQELAHVISVNYKNKLEGKQSFEFCIPPYVKEAIEWICQKK